MISKTTFIDEIKNNLFTKLKKEEKKRKILLLVAFLFFISPIVLISSIDIYNNKYTEFLLLFYFFFILLFYIIGAVFIETIKEKYTPCLYHLLSNTLEYNYKGIKTEQAFNNVLDTAEYSLLFPYFHVTNPYEKIHFKRNSTHFSLLKLKLVNGMNKHTNTFFNGWIIDILADEQKKGYSLFFSKKSMYKISTLNKVKSTYEGHKFQIFSDNEIEANKFFNPLFIEKIFNMKKILNANWIGISYYSNHIVFALKCSENTLSPFYSLNSLMDTKKYEIFYDQICCLFELIDFLNINSNCEIKDQQTNNELYLKESKNKKKYTRGTEDYIIIAVAILFPILLYILINTKP